jgi:LEA14-like dessication related protein
MGRTTAGPVRAAWALALALAAGCAGLAGERPGLDVALVGLAPREISPLEQVLDLSLRVRNPNNRPLTLTGARFELDLDGRPILRGLSNARVEIPRLGSALMRAEGSTTTIGLIKQIFEFSPDQPLRYRLKGVAFADGLLAEEGIPFESAGELDLRPPGGRRR